MRISEANILGNSAGEYEDEYPGMPCGTFILRTY